MWRFLKFGQNRKGLSKFEQKMGGANILIQNWDLLFVFVRQKYGACHSWPAGYQHSGVALALELGSPPHPSLPFTPGKPCTLLKHNIFNNASSSSLKDCQGCQGPKL